MITPSPRCRRSPRRREANMALLSRYLLTLLAASTTACRYEEATTYRANKMFFTEYYMYASDEGPFPFTGGDSYALADLRAKLSMKGARANVTVMAFSTDEELDSIDSIDLCLGNVNTVSPREKRKTFAVTGDHPSHLYLKYTVHTAGLQYLALQVCDGGWLSGMELNGVFEFKNPYGFVPGRYFGFLPFEGARCIFFSLFVLYYLCVLCAHSGRLLPLHFLTFIVLLCVCGGKRGSFRGISRTEFHRPAPVLPLSSNCRGLDGPGTTEAGATRVLLLVVSLGYGLVRPRLRRTEECGVIVLTAAYVTASFFATIAKVKNAADPDFAAGPLVPLMVELPVLLFDLVFLACIYAALVKTMDSLRDSGPDLQAREILAPGEGAGWVCVSRVGVERVYLSRRANRFHYSSGRTRSTGSRASRRRF